MFLISFLISFVMLLLFFECFLFSPPFWFVVASFSSTVSLLYCLLHLLSWILLFFSFWLSFWLSSRVARICAPCPPLPLPVRLLLSIPCGGETRGSEEAESVAQCGATRHQETPPTTTNSDMTCSLPMRVVHIMILIFVSIVLLLCICVYCFLVIWFFSRKLHAKKTHINAGKSI